MKIAVFTDSFLPYICGATFAILNQINELAKRGHKISVFCPRSFKRKKRPSSLTELHPAVRVHEIASSFPYPKIPNLSVTIPSFYFSIKNIRKFQPDIIHVHTEWGCGWEGVMAGKNLGIPIVGTFHTFWEDPGYVKSFPLPDWPLTRLLMGKYSTSFYQRCEVVITPSQTVQTYLNKKVKDLNTTIVSNGIPKQKNLNTNYIHHRSKIGLNAQTTFIYIGRVSYEKSLDICIKAFQEVLRGYPGIRFVIVGDGPSFHQLKKQIKSLKLETSVILLGLIDHEKLIEENIPRIGDVFITASETENQPVSILEAMSFGLPIIGPDAKGIPELVKHGENGLLFEPGNINQLSSAMIELIESPQRRQGMGVQSSVIAEQHSIENTVTRLEEIYQNHVVRN